MLGRLTLPNHEPVFLNEGTSYAELKLKKMEALRSVVSERGRSQLDEDIRLVQAGISGERKIIYELKSCHYPLIFIHDLNLEHEGNRAQIDFLVVTPYHVVAIETKNLIGNIEIDESGAFIRTITRNRRRIQEGIYSPITQNAHHIELMKAIAMSESGSVIRKIQRYLLDDYYKSVVVLANERTVLKADRAPKEVRSQVIRADQLVRYIKDLDAAVSKKELVSTFKEMEASAHRWLSRNAPAKVDHSETYEIVSRHQTSHAETRPSPSPKSASHAS